MDEKVIVGSLSVQVSAYLPWGYQLQLLGGVGLVCRDGHDTGQCSKTSGVVRSRAWVGDPASGVHV